MKKWQKININQPKSIEKVDVGCITRPLYYILEKNKTDKEEDDKL